MVHHSGSGSTTLFQRPQKFPGRIRWIHTVIILTLGTLRLCNVSILKCYAKQILAITIRTQVGNNNFLNMYGTLTIKKTFTGTRVAVPRCLSRIQLQEQKIGGNISCTTFFSKKQISQNWKLFYFWTGKEKKLSCFTQNVTKLSKIWVWDPESGKPFRIPDPGVLIQQHWSLPTGTIHSTRFSKHLWIRIRDSEPRMTYHIENM